jgi:hypothetical protein
MTLKLNKKIVILQSHNLLFILVVLYCHLLSPLSLIIHCIKGYIINTCETIVYNETRLI